MALTVAEKVIKEHIVIGEMVRGTEIGIKIDQTLTQDSTGTMAYLQFEAMDIPRVKTKKSLAYIDHNMLQAGPENMDDHLYIQTVANKYGVHFSKPGNGICHQVNLERFGIPGQTLLGSDSHTPTGGGIGMIAIGAGGLDVAVAMAGGEYYITMPHIVKVELRGKLRQGVSSKDIILEVLKRCSVKGGINKIFEYCGDGIKNLSVPDRATITNMGAELGATTSIFPSDENTLNFLKAQNREEDYREIKADIGAKYDEEIIIDLDVLEPMAACPHSPDNIKLINEIEGMKIHQVAIGSCTNSSYVDLMKVAEILDGKTVSDDVSLVISPGSKQVLNMLADNGALGKMINAGARILECGCGPCIGMGQAPCTEGVSLRTFNRNFKGRSGTVSADVYLVSPETAAVSAIHGKLINPLGESSISDIIVPQEFLINDNMVVEPAKDGENIEVIKGPNIKPFPKAEKLGKIIDKKVLIKLEDNITTDHIMPSNAKLLPYRSNIPYLSDFCLSPCDDKFPDRAKNEDGGIIVAGHNYGQGSSREHAALAPLYLGIKAVVTKSFARIHKNNLINNGIIPLVFSNEEDYNLIEMNDEIVLENAIEGVQEGKLTAYIKNKEQKIDVIVDVTERQKDILISGGLINYIKQKNK